MKMTFKRFDLLEAIELWAADNGCISNEQELSELFDSDIAPMVVAEYGANDIDAIREAFNNWSDALRDDDLIHEHQYNHYGYVGKYSDEQ